MRRLAMLVALATGSTGCDKTTSTLAAQTEPGTIDERWRDFIKVEKLASVDAPTFVATTGRVAFDDNSTQRVGAPVSGRVATVAVQLGDQVKAGQPLVELSSPEVAQLQADVKKSLQDLQVARTAWERTRRLQADGAVSDKDAAEAAATYSKAQTEVERGEAQLAALGLRARDPVVRAALFARVSGTVVERNVWVGQEVRADAGAPLLTLTNLDTVWVLADVYEPDLGQVQNGAPVRVRVPAYPDETFPGKVAYIGDVVDPQSRTVKVRCIVPNEGRRLKPEMFARVDLEQVGPSRAVFVPTKAVVSDGSHTRVLIVTDERHVRAQPVVLGPEIEGKHRVIKGLQEGDTIVTEGAVFLANTLED